MTLQLRVGGTYRARNGDVVKVLGSGGMSEYPYRGDDGQEYAVSGAWSLDGTRTEWDLIEEITPPSPASELDEAIAKFERVWSDAKQAMDKVQLAAEDVAQAINAAKESTNEQG